MRERNPHIPTDDVTRSQSAESSQSHTVRVCVAFKSHQVEDSAETTTTRLQNDVRCDENAGGGAPALQAANSSSRLTGRAVTSSLSPNDEVTHNEVTALKQSDVMET